MNTVDVQALVAGDSFFGTISEVVPELHASSPGYVQSSRVPSLRAVIVDAGSVIYP